MRLLDRFRYARFLLGVVFPWIALAAPVLGQDELSRVRLGVGAAMSGDYRAGWGGHGLLEFSASPGARFDLRGSGLFAVGGFSNPFSTVFGLDVLGVVALGSDNRPYLGLGLGYSHTDLSASQPFAHDLGWSAAVGFEWRTWFVESRLRWWGNVFYQPTSTKSVFLVSLGRSLWGR